MEVAAAQEAATAPSAEEPPDVHAAEAAGDRASTPAAPLRQWDDISGEPTPAIAALSQGRSSDNTNSDTDESGDEGAFEDCLEFQTPRPLTASAAAPPTEAPVAAEAKLLEGPVLLQPLHRQTIYVLSFSVLLRAASVTCSLGQRRRKDIQYQPQERGPPPQEPQDLQQSNRGLLQCSIACLRVDGFVGSQGIEGSASVGRLGISHKGGDLEQEQRLVYRQTGAEDEPLLLIHAARSPDTCEREATSSNIGSNTADDRGAAAQLSEQPGAAAGDHGENAEMPSDTFVVCIKVRRVICFLAPDALRDISLLGKSFSAAAVAAASAAAESSQECSFVCLRSSSSGDGKPNGDVKGAGMGAGRTEGRMGLRQRLLLLSSKRQQQLRASASLRYSASVEAPTLIAPAAEGRAVLFHLGELRVGPQASNVQNVSARTVCYLSVCRAPSSLSTNVELLKQWHILYYSVYISLCVSVAPTLHCFAEGRHTLPKGRTEHPPLLPGASCLLVCFQRRFAVPSGRSPRRLAGGQRQQAQREILSLLTPSFTAVTITFSRALQRRRQQVQR